MDVELPLWTANEKAAENNKRREELQEKRHQPQDLKNCPITLK